MAGLGAQEATVEILGQRAGAHQQLRRQRAHDRGQNRRQQHAGDPRVEQHFRQHDEHALGVGIDRPGHVGMRGEVRDAEEASRHRAGQAQDHPGHADAARAWNRVQAVGGHEARQDVRLAEIAQTPGQRRDHRDHAPGADPVQPGRIDLFHQRQRLRRAPDADDREHRHQQQREDHQRGLDGVGPAHRQEAADEGVEDGDRRAPEHRLAVGQAEHAFEHARAGDDARGAIDREEHQDHQRRQHPQHAAMVLEAMGEVVRQGQRIAGAFGVDAQRAGDVLPVRPRAQDQADRDPGFGGAAQIQRAGQAHQQPAAHVRSAGRQRGDEAAERAPAEDVIVEGLGAAPGDKTQTHHQQQVGGEGDKQGSAGGHVVRIPGRKLVTSVWPGARSRRHRPSAQDARSTGPRSCAGRSRPPAHPCRLTMRRRGGVSGARIVLVLRLADAGMSTVWPRRETTRDQPGCPRKRSIIVVRMIWPHRAGHGHAMKAPGIRRNEPNLAPSHAAEAHHMEPPPSTRSPCHRTSCWACSICCRTWCSSSRTRSAATPMSTRP